MAPRDRGNGRSHEGLKINLRSRLHKWPALGQLIGHEAPAGEACVPCARGNGPFDSCRIVFMLGSGFQWSLACACCQYSGAANKCSLREFLPSLYLSVRQHRPMVHIIFQGGAPDRNSRYGRKQCARLFPSVQRGGSGIFLFALPAQPTWQHKTQKQKVRAYFTQDGTLDAKDAVSKLQEAHFEEYNIPLLVVIGIRPVLLKRMARTRRVWGHSSWR